VGGVGDVHETGFELGPLQGLTVAPAMQGDAVLPALAEVDVAQKAGLEGLEVSHLVAHMSMIKPRNYREM